MPTEPCWRAAARWWVQQEPDLPRAELAAMLGVAVRTLDSELAPPPRRMPAQQRRVDEVKAAVRSGASYDTLAKRFDWPH